MAELVDDLIEKGYLTKEPDPTDGRAKLIMFTERAYRAIPLALDRFEEIELTWARTLGDGSVTDLRATLEDILDMYAQDA